MDWITDDIAIGNIEDALRIERLPAAGITAILSLNGWPNHSWNVVDLPWRCVTLLDGHGNSVDLLVEAVDALRGFRTDGHRVLVHCMEGVSRSALVVACYLAGSLEVGFQEALEVVSGRRPGVRVQQGLLLLQQEYFAASRD